MKLSGIRIRLGPGFSSAILKRLRIVLMAGLMFRFPYKMCSNLKKTLHASPNPQVLNSWCRILWEVRGQRGWRVRVYE